MKRYKINYESVPHGVISWRHDGADAVYCEAGVEVRITWQPSAGWGLSEAHYTDAQGNEVAINTKEMAFTMPESDITIGGTFKRFVVTDWEGYEGGGGGGTTDYNGLDNKPSINGVTLQGNKTGKELKLDDVKYVSTFEGVTGDVDVLYFLDTEYDTYKVGFYRFIEAQGTEPAKFVGISSSSVKYVSTFTGVVGNTEELYYLDTAYDNYEVGFYRFVEATTTEPEKFVILNKQRFKYVSTFTGEVGDTNRLYYLDTAYDDFKKGFYRYNGTAFVNINPKEFFYVSTFNGVEGDDEALYFLDTNYDEYTIGFYRYVEVEEAGVTVGKFIHTGNPHQLQVTYAKLKEMRDNSMLIAGMQYRITDYVATTVQANTRSANHPFDIIVTADSANTLNENAYAALHNGDTYFANNDLTAWKLKYCLDNDTSRFAWADATNGKGVVYYMKDEFDNECPYDFKGVQFERWKVRDSLSGRSGLNGKYVGIQGTSIEKLTIQSATNFIWAYTFSSNASGGGQADYSLEKSRNVYGNVIGYANGSLNNCVFYGTNCYGNTFGIGSQHNTFCGSCFRNTFGGYIIANAIGGSFVDNVIDSYVVNNSFGTQFCQNSVGSNFQINAFGDDCRSNVFGANNQYIIFGKSCNYNAFGQNCYYITFGSYLSYITVSSGVSYCNVKGGDSGAVRKNAKILEGVMGTTPSKRLAITFKDKTPYTQFAAMTTDGKLRIWNPADEFEEKENIIDVTVLPTTDIDTQALYRLTTTHYYHNVTELAAEPQGYKSLNEEALVADENGLTAIEGETSTTTPWAEVTDAMIATLVSGSLVATCEFGEAGFFKTAADEYDYAGNFYTTDTYTLWHNATGEPTDWVEVDSVSNLVTDGETTEDVDGELRANAIIDVDVFPTSGIKEATFYRKREDHFIDASDNEVVAIAKYICDGEHLEASAVGLIDKSTGTPTPWAALTDAIVDGYVASGYCRVTEAIGNTPNALYFIKTGTDTYAHLMCIQTKSLYHHEDGAWKLVSEDSTPDNVTIQTVNGKLQANAIVDVTALPTTGIKAKTIYRMLVDRYFEDGTELSDTPSGYLSIRPAIVIIDENGITDNGTHYAWADITDDQMDFWVIRRQISQVYAADLMTMSTCFRTAENHYVYKDHVTEEGVYELYHNPTATANAYIKIGGEGGSAEVDDVTTEEVNGKVQANAVIEVNSLPTTDIKTKSLYRRMETIYKHDGVEVPNVTIYKVRLNDTIEATPEGMRYKPSGPVVAWDAANIGSVIQQAITDEHVETTTWDDAEFFAFGDGEYDYENHFSRILPGSLWQNRTGAAAGWEEVGGEQAVDEVTIVEEHGILKAMAVIDVTQLPSAGMKGNSLYRKVETVMVPGMHIYTTYYHGGNDPVPEPVECYKPARAGVEFRSNEIYIDGVEHSYEELKAYRADWVASGYIEACDFLDIDTTTNDGGVGYPNEGSYQFLNRDKYTYNTDPVPVVMNKIFQYTPSGEWESISTVELTNAAYNLLDYEQKMDGTTYIVED